jgi:hypothetical protein
MRTTNEICVAPPSSVMATSLERHREWLEGVLGCGLGESVTLEVEMPLGRIALEDVLRGVPLDDEPVTDRPRTFYMRRSFGRMPIAVPIEDVGQDEGGTSSAPLRPLIRRCEIPHGFAPRVRLEPSRDQAAADASFKWNARWTDTPVAVWLQGVDHAIVAVTVPYATFHFESDTTPVTWVIVNRSDVQKALALLRTLFVMPRKVLRVIGGTDVALDEGAYDWGNVVLSSAVSQLVRDDFENFLRREDWFRRHGLAYRRGYLLHGPPGNGKTSVVRVMTSHPSVTPYALDFSNSDLTNSDLTTLFVAAGRSAPSIIVFEDLDRVYGRDETRDGHNPDNHTSITLQHLLNCLDGLWSQDGVIVVATANEPRALDRAVLRRPGRFDRTVAFDTPSVTLRREYLKRLNVARWDQDVLEATAQESDGLSFAQLREAFIVGSQRAFDRGDENIEQGDVVEGVRRLRSEWFQTGKRVSHRSAGFRRA